MRTVLAPETWNDIRTAYLAGENARALARQWRISTSAIYRRAVNEGWAKIARAPSATDDPRARGGGRTRADARRRSHV